MQKRTLAQVKQELRQRHIDNNVLRRVYRMEASAWTTAELVQQMVDEGFDKAGWADRWWVIMAEHQPTPERFRRYVCWQLVTARWSWYKKDPVHPADAEPAPEQGEAPADVTKITKESLGFS